MSKCLIGKVEIKNVGDGSHKLEKRDGKMGRKIHPWRFQAANEIFKNVIDMLHGVYLKRETVSLEEIILKSIMPIWHIRIINGDCAEA